MSRRNGGGRTLRFTESAEAMPGHYQVEVALEGAGARLTATVPLALALTAQDRERIRWYLEDYLLFPLDPAPKIAADIEARMAEIGDKLCEALFLANRDTTRLWDRAREELADTRVEVITDVRHAASVPWELIRDPESKTPLALEAQAFVRGHRMATKIPRTPDTGGGPIRILLVICRPRAGKDVPFRSVAAQLLKGLDRASREVVELDVLRPPTFEALARKLRAATCPTSVRSPSSMDSPSSSTARGRPPTALGRRPTSLGRRPTSLGRGPSALGRRTTALGRRPTALGRSPAGLGRSPAGLGRSPAALGRRATALGRRATALGRSPAALGRSPAALGRRATALGRRPSASGLNPGPTS